MRGPASTHVVELLRRFVGLDVAGEGILEEPWAGHASGAHYLVIRAESGMERQLARDALGDLAGLTDLAWEHGWTGRRLGDGQVVTELKIFPADRQERPRDAAA
jgi:hypothetical protein